MKTIKTCGGVLATLAALPWAVCAHDQAVPTIREKLEHEYQLTKTNYDKTEIVTAGSVIVLHKDKVLMFAVTTPANPCMNTYRDGKITQNFACKVAVAKPPVPIPGKDKVPASQYFVSGQKFWVTKIDVKDTGKEHGAVFDFFSDAINDVRYKGVLTIPFGASSPPPDEALKIVAEVIAVDDAKKDADKEQPADPDGQPAAAAPNQPTPTPSPAPAEPMPTPLEPPPPPPTKVSGGQTIDQVVAALGQPVDIVEVGNKVIYVYKSLKVTFVNGKVKDVE
jgi:hypothetical protein